MINVTEKQCSFLKTITDANGQVISEKTISYTPFVVSYEGKDTVVLYDHDMNFDDDVYRFLKQGRLSINTKKQYAYHLALGRAFEDIYEKSLQNFTSDDLSRFKDFLIGVSYKTGTTIAINLSTTRSAKTVNLILATHREFLKYLGIHTGPWFNTRISANYGTAQKRFHIYTSNAKTPHVPEEVPMYISVPEFTEILHYIRENDTLQSEAIVRLMYQCGLRIGEVLGLTYEDIQDETIDVNGQLLQVHMLYIRNRCSDQPDQHAKTCMQVTYPAQYTYRDYWEDGYGYQKVACPDDLFDALMELITESDDIPSEKRKNVADKVTDHQDIDRNFYIFVNKWHKPLRQKPWNETLRKIFGALDIPIDMNTRKHGLSHRFRHGFAMFQVKYRHADILTLQRLMRHASQTSTETYFRPTSSDIMQMKNELISDMETMIPALKEHYIYKSKRNLLNG